MFFTLIKTAFSGVNALFLTGALSFVAGAYIAWGWMDNRADAALANAHKAYSAALQKARAAEDAGHVAAARLLEQEQTHRNLQKERDDAIRKLTEGRPCLAAATVRLLNSPPERPLPDAASGVALRDTAVATDTDIALWAADARLEHDICRGRINALRNWVGAMASSPSYTTAGTPSLPEGNTLPGIYARGRENQVIRDQVSGIRYQNR
ncbi:hypothetical protein FACS1894185_3450 [Betaproteobacteria bacterium]|nr:hypothetical protein FACS1894185_3450 [Betaproteobacteria bacterium]